MLNQTIIVGHLGEDPKEFFSAEGVAVTSFDLAFQAAKKKTGWIKIICFKSLAELCQKYLHKGAKIAISGQLDQNKWTDKEGQNHSSFQIIGNTLEFIKTDGRGFKDSEATVETINDEVPF
jgi:single-strand DNA-binding protein